MRRSEAIDRLNAIRERWSHDPETAHAEAEAVLLLLAGIEVQAAYQEIVNACRWWAYA